MGQAVARVRPEASLKQSWANLRNDYPQIHARDAARQLGVNEAQLVATVWRNRNPPDQGLARSS